MDDKQINSDPALQREVADLLLELMKRGLQERQANASGLLKTAQAWAIVAHGPSAAPTLTSDASDAAE